MPRSPARFLPSAHSLILPLARPSTSLMRALISPPFSLRLTSRPRTVSHCLAGPTAQRPFFLPGS